LKTCEANWRWRGGVGSADAGMCCARGDVNFVEAGISALPMRGCAAHAGVPTGVGAGGIGFADAGMCCARGDVNWRWRGGIGSADAGVRYARGDVNFVDAGGTASLLLGCASHAQSLRGRPPCAILLIFGYVVGMYHVNYRCSTLDLPKG
jgi:hypothetical protein